MTATTPEGKTMTKTEARKHIADARRSLATASTMLNPPRSWERESGNHLSLHQRQRIFNAHMRAAAQALAALAEYEVADR